MLIKVMAAALGHLAYNLTVEATLSKATLPEATLSKIHIQVLKQ